MICCALRTGKQMGEACLDSTVLEQAGQCTGRGIVLEWPKWQAPLVKPQTFQGGNSGSWLPGEAVGGPMPDTSAPWPA